jgi:hypothetical protein
MTLLADFEIWMFISQNLRETYGIYLAETEPASVLTRAVTHPVVHQDHRPRWAVGVERRRVSVKKTHRFVPDGGPSARL